MIKILGLMMTLVVAAIGTGAMNEASSQGRCDMCTPDNCPETCKINLPDYRAKKERAYFRSKYSLGNKCYFDHFREDSTRLLKGDGCPVSLDSIGSAEGTVGARNFSLEFVDARDGDDFFMRFKFDWVVTSGEAYECAGTFCYDTKRNGEVWHAGDHIDLRYDVNQQ